MKQLSNFAVPDLALVLNETFLRFCVLFFFGGGGGVETNFDAFLSKVEN